MGKVGMLQANMKILDRPDMFSDTQWLPKYRHPYGLKRFLICIIILFHVVIFIFLIIKIIL